MARRKFGIEEITLSNGLCMLRITDQFNIFYGGIGGLFNFTTQAVLEKAVEIKETIENAYQKGLLGAVELAFKTGQHDRSSAQLNS